MSEGYRPWQLGLDHLGISVTDVARSEAFYRDVLGAEVIFPRHTMEWGERSIVAVGSQAIDLNQLRGNHGVAFDPAHTGLDHLAFTADSVDHLSAWARWLDEHDVVRSPIREVRADPGQALAAPVVGAMFDFVDPDGIQLEFLFFGANANPVVELGGES
jgi:glyoxylase I family protein